MGFSCGILGVVLLNQERGGASFAPQRRSPKGAVGPKPIDGSLVEINHGAACLDFASGPWKTGFLDANVSVTCRSKSHVHACMHACMYSGHPRFLAEVGVAGRERNGRSRPPPPPQLQP